MLSRRCGLLCARHCEYIANKNIHATIQAFKNDVKVMLPLKTKGGHQESVFLTKDGVRLLLCRSRKHRAVTVADQLGIDIKNIMVVPFESTVVDVITRVFASEEIKTQYTVNNARVDLYFSEHNLAIEINEPYHDSTLQQELDKDRENRIKQQIGCRFIRIKHDEHPCDFLRKIYDSLHRKL